MRLVEMRGCMADVRGRIQGGTIIDFVSRQVYGDTQPQKYAVICLDDGFKRELPAHPWLWTTFDGVLEYHY